MYPLSKWPTSHSQLRDWTSFRGNKGLPWNLQVKSAVPVLVNAITSSNNENLKAISEGQRLPGAPFV